MIIYQKSGTITKTKKAKIKKGLLKKDKAVYFESDGFSVAVPVSDLKGIESLTSIDGKFQPEIFNGCTISLQLDSGQVYDEKSTMIAQQKQQMVQQKQVLEIQKKQMQERQVQESQQLQSQRKISIEQQQKQQMKERKQIIQQKLEQKRLREELIAKRRDKL